MISRRTLLKLTAATVTAAAAGCTPDEVDDLLDWVFPGLDDLELGEVQLAWDRDGNLYEIRPSSHTVSRVTNGGDVVWSVGGDAAEGGLNYPVSVASTANHQVVVVEHGGDRLGIYDDGGGFLRYIGEAGTGDGQLFGASDAVLDEDGRIFVADGQNHRVQVFDSGGEFLWSFGHAGSDTEALQSPRSLAFDQDGYLHIVDTGNARVQVFTPGGRFVRSYGSRGTGDGQLESPRSVSIDPLGNAWVADPVGRAVQVYTPDGAPLTRFSNLKIGDIEVQPLRAALTPDGTFYVHVNLIRVE